MPDQPPGVTLDLIPVDQNDLILESPLPYDLYDRNSRLLMKKGEMLTQRKYRDLLKNSWRLRSPDTPTSAPSTETFEMARPAPTSTATCVRRPLAEAKVLIADDIKLSQKLLANMLNQQRLYNIETADDGSSAIKKFQARHFDLVFLDIDMPVMDGLGALAAIKAHNPSVFVCLVSGSSTLANVIKAQQLGVNGFLVKPINGLKIERILKTYTKDCAKLPPR